MVADDDDLARRAELYTAIITALTTVEPHDRMNTLLLVLRNEWGTRRAVARVWYEVRQPANAMRVIGEKR